MVLLITTTRILNALESISPSNRDDLTLPYSPTLGSPISHDQLIRLSRYLRTQHQDAAQGGNAIPKSWSLSALLQGTKVYVPPPPKKPEPSAEYQAQKARLLAAAEKDAYNALLHSTHTLHTPTSIFTTSTPTLSALNTPHAASSSTIHDKDPITPSLVLNIFLSVLLTGFSTYWALTSFRVSHVPVPFISPGRDGGGGMTEPVRVFLSLGAAGLVAIAEVVIYAVYLGKIADARVREGRVRERKVVIEREVLGRMDDGDVYDVREEEIWGKGANGGVRRRVRERWDREKEDTPGS